MIVFTINSGATSNSNTLKARTGTFRNIPLKAIAARPVKTRKSAHAFIFLSLIKSVFRMNKNREHVRITSKRCMLNKLALLSLAKKIKSYKY
jgi:hypothetical protein